MAKRAWWTFAVVQFFGCVLLSYGTVYSESAFVRGSWFVGSLLLLPGTIPGLAVSGKLVHIRTAYLFIPMAVGCNAALWLAVAGVWRTLRRDGANAHPYISATSITLLLFVMANTVHFLRPVDCYDCFFPYGVPFTIYHEGGYAGGAGFDWAGIGFNTAIVLVIAALLGRAFQVVNARRAR